MPALLRLDPLWDPLHVDPVFQKLCKKINRKKTISMTDPGNDTPAQPVWC